MDFQSTALPTELPSRFIYENSPLLLYLDFRPFNRGRKFFKTKAEAERLSRLCKNKTYFLTCRDAAKATPSSSHQTAYNINLALASPQLRVIGIVHRGQAGLNSGKAAEFRYLLPDN